MRRTLSRAGQKVAGAFRWLIVSLISAAVFVPLAIIASSEV
ncbi:MAG: hypothetical protein ABL873_04985 [Gallionella sp.]|nr:hypothetical protein [Gallionella sp.]